MKINDEGICYSQKDSFSKHLYVEHMDFLQGWQLVEDEKQGPTIRIGFTQ